MLVRSLLFLLCLMCTLTTATPSCWGMVARPVPQGNFDEGTEFPVAIQVSVGLLNGEAHELVYDNNHKISELIWKLQNVPMLGLSASLGLPWDMGLHLAAWTKVTKAKSYMEDFDWGDTYPNDWSHYSRTDTNLTNGEMFDANLTFPLLKGDSAKLEALVGFKHDHWRWTDNGGRYVYSRNGGFRNSEGTFPDRIGITYEQWFYVPYAGMQGELIFGEWTVGGRFAGSRWAWANDRDNHLMRSIIFKDSFKYIGYLTAGLNLSYACTEQVTATFSIDYQRYFRTRGDTDVSTVDQTDHYDDGAGIEHYSWMPALSLSYRF